MKPAYKKLLSFACHARFKVPLSLQQIRVDNIAATGIGSTSVRRKKDAMECLAG